MKTASILGMVTTTLALSAGANAGDGIAALRDNIVAQLTFAEPADGIAEHLSKVQADGSFSDLDYTPDPLTNQPYKHVGRLHDMAVAWGCPTSASYQDATLKSAILRVYGYWVSHDIQHRNWWFNEIGTPDSLSDTMLILQKHDVLPADSFRKAIAIVDRALPRQQNLSAANLVWTAYATRNEGVLAYFDSAANDAERAAATALVKQSFERIGSTVKFTNSDGVNADFSFHAHGPVPYNGGYGSAWINDTARIAASAAGTGFGLTADQVRLMIDLALDGNQFMIRGINYDLAVTGRDWSRANHSGTALGLATAVDYLAAAEPSYRAGELKTLKTRLANAKKNRAADPGDAPVGNRAYYTADYMAHQRGAYLLSVKTLSKRTNVPEAMNGENGKGGNAFNGLNLIYRTGNEYADVEPLWDWYRLPGTTSERAAGGVGGSYDIKPPSGGKRGPTAIAGGASDGSVGAQAYQFSQNGVTANKSWFLFERGEVALGSAITQAKPTSPGGVVGTNVNQTLVHGDVVYSDAVGKSTTLGVDQSIAPKGLRWVHHDSVGYLFLAPADNVTIRNVPRTGAWTDINLGGYSGEKFTRGLFDLDIDHGATPTAAGYAYAVVPGIDAAETEALCASEPFSVLRNDAVAQAVTDEAAGVTEANFFGAGDVRLRDGTTLTLAVDQSASVLIRRDGSTCTVSVASPAHFAGQITLTLSGHYAGANAAWDAAAGATAMTFDLPAGTTAGRTVTQTFDAALK